MNSDRQNREDLLNAIVGNVLVSGQGLDKEMPYANALVFYRTANTLTKAYDDEAKRKFTILSVDPNRYQLDETVLSVVQQNLKSGIFNESGKLSVNTEEKWRYATGDANSLGKLRDADANAVSISNDPESINQLNAFLIENLASNPEYVEALEKRAADFIKASEKFSLHVPKGLVSYLTNMVDFAHQVNREFMGNTLESEMQKQF